MVKKIKTTDIISTMASDKDCLIIDEDMLTKHTLFVGATGSGKTTTMNVLLRDLIRHKSDCAAQKIGLLIFDFKDDGMIHKIKKWAKECRRSKDVVSYSAGSGIYFNPFAEFSAFEHTGSIVDMLTALMPPEGGDNRYWDLALRKRIKFVLHSMILFEVPITFESFAEWFLGLITSNLSDWKKGLAKSLKALIALSKQAGEPLKSEYEKILKIAVNLKAQIEE